MDELRADVLRKKLCDDVLMFFVVEVFRSLLCSFLVTPLHKRIPKRKVCKYYRLIPLNLMGDLPFSHTEIRDKLSKVGW